MTKTQKKPASKLVADQLMEALDLSQTGLASLLGVSERSLATWKKQGAKDTSPKAFRMLRLWKVIEYLRGRQIEGIGTDLTPALMRAILENSRILLDEEDEGEGDISLIGYIRAYPKEKTWKTCLQFAINDFTK